MTPTILCPDGVYRTQLNFSTNVLSRFFTGNLTTDVVDVEVSFDGGAWLRDSDYVVFESGVWTVPSSLVFPDGLPLDGLQSIRVRAVLGDTGSVSSPAEILVQRVATSSVLAQPPTGLSVEQQDGSVTLTVSGAPSDVRGINFYASTTAGVGYTRINLNTVVTPTRQEVTTRISSLEIQSEVTDNTIVYTGTQGSSINFTETVQIPVGAETIRSSMLTETVSLVDTFSFLHRRTAGATSTPPTIYTGAFASIPTTDPLFYVATGVYYDEETRTEIESSYSVEVAATPLTVSTNAGSFPEVSQQQIVRNVIQAIYRSSPNTRTDPGSVTRDVFVDPFAAEATQERFLIDFLHRATTFPGLLSIDDPTGSGVSIPVSSSNYKLTLKQAFGLTTDSDVQATIDWCFETLAANWGLTRRPGRFARGEATFYTPRRPTQAIPIPLGTVISGGGIQFKVLSATSLTSSMYDPTTGTYRVTVPVQAVLTGSKGNIAQGQVRKVVTGPQISVVNTSNMFGGTDQETNTQLARRAMNTLASVDSGTARGYLQTAANVPGVIQAQVVPAGDPLMWRDFEDGKHWGGKVDIWVQSASSFQATVTETFSYSQATERNVHFVYLGANTFRAVTGVSTTSPITVMLDDESRNLGLRNASTGLWFDLTDVAILGYDTIRLSEDVVQPPVTLTDVVLGDFRRLEEQAPYTFLRQPVHSVLSVTGQATGELTSDQYQLLHTQDPLLEGRSIRAADQLDLNPPSYSPIQVTGEFHVLEGQYPVYLDYVGADALTLVVSSTEGVVYKGPDDPNGFADYTILYGNQVGIVRTDFSEIPSGGTVLCSYQHGENYTVQYRVNPLVATVQEAVDAKRHVTADVLVKEAYPVPVDIAATVVLLRGADQPSADKAIRTNLANLFSRFRLGDGVHQSDVVAAIEGARGVNYVNVPLTQMARTKGTTVVRESLLNGVTYLPAWSTPTIAVWLLNDPLGSPTTSGGGPLTDYRGVFQDGVPLTLLDPGQSPATLLKVQAGRAAIVDTAVSGSVSIQNQVVVSTLVDDAASNHNYTVTYVTTTGNTAGDILPGKAEYLVLGSVLLTFVAGNG